MKFTFNKWDSLSKKQKKSIVIIVVMGIIFGSLILGVSKSKPTGNQQEHSDHDAPSKKEGDHHDEKEEKLVLTDAQIKAAGVTIQIARASRIKTGIMLPGEIRLNEDRTAHIVSRLPGIVESVSANLGQHVKAGDVLAVIASTTLSAQRSELLAAKKRLAFAKITLEREKKLWEEKITAEQDYLQAQQVMREAEIAVENTSQQLAAVGVNPNEPPTDALNRYEIRAPFDATVIEKHITLGEAIGENTNIFTLSDLSIVWVEIIISTKDLHTVQVGAKAIIKASGFDSQRGSVSYVGALLGAQTRTATAKVSLTNPQMAWRPGLFVNVEIISSEIEVPIAVSSEAVQTINNKPTIFAKVPGGFIPQAVTLGRSDGQLTEIISGIKAETAYAATGSFVLKSELGKSNAEHGH